MIMSAGDKTSSKKTNFKDLSHSNQAKNKKTKVNSGKLLNIHLFSDNQICSGLRRKIEESKMEMKKLDDKKEDLVLMNVEKEWTRFAVLSVLFIGTIFGADCAC